MRDDTQRLAAQAELARRHYWIAEMTYREGLPVDWRFVAVRMAQALAGLPEATLGEGDVLWPPRGVPEDVAHEVGDDAPITLTAEQVRRLGGTR